MVPIIVRKPTTYAMDRSAMKRRNTNMPAKVNVLPISDKTDRNC